MALKIKLLEGGPALIACTDYEIELHPKDKQPNQGIQGIFNTSKNGTIALCRCGKSKDGIFCDGSHKTKDNGQ